MLLKTCVRKAFDNVIIHTRVASFLTGVRRCEHAVKCCCAEVLFVDVIEVVFVNVIEVWIDPKVEPKRANIEAWIDPKVDPAGHCQ